MPWCESCDKYRSPNALLPDGTCPRCRSHVDVGEVASVAADGQAVPQSLKVPWHFWLMVTAAAVYLGWRAVQALMMLF